MSIAAIYAQRALTEQGHNGLSFTDASGVSTSSGSAPAASGTSSSVQPSSPAPGPAPLTGDQTIFAVSLIAVAMLLAGAVVIWARSGQGPKHATLGNSYIRAWVAIALVMGLLLFTALSFGISDSTLRNTLIGGLTASVGSAIAFYFSSSSGAQARQDMLTAAGKTDSVPNLKGKTKDEAIKTLGSTSFKFEIDPTGNPTPSETDTIDKTAPAPGDIAPVGSTVLAHFDDGVT
jgi:PASTA domain